MRISDEQRRRFLIAQGMDELLEFCRIARFGGQAGYPVWAIPFGAADDEGSVIRDEPELMRLSPGLLAGSTFGYVHIIKTAHYSGR